LGATLKARTKAVMDKEVIKIDRFNNVISYLEYEKAVVNPTIYEERALASNSVMTMPR
jgi:hypothetical protein